MSAKRKSEHLRREEVIKAFGIQVRSLREKYDFSQTELSLLSGIAVSYISKIEGGKFNLSLSHIAALGEAFEIPLHELMKFSD